MIRNRFAGIMFIFFCFIFHYQISISASETVNSANINNNTKSSKSISKVKTLEFDVDENIKYNKEMRETKYTIKFIIPNKIRKEITFPQMNKGELYIYNDNKKLTYLPFFDQKKIDNISGNENKIIEIMNYIFQMEKSDTNFRKEYYKKQVKGIKLGKDTIINFTKYDYFNGYLFPTDFLITDKNKPIGEIHINNILVDPKFDDKEFVIE